MLRLMRSMLKPCLASCQFLSAFPNLGHDTSRPPSPFWCTSTPPTTVGGHQMVVAEGAQAASEVFRAMMIWLMSAAVAAGR